MSNHPNDLTRRTILKSGLAGGLAIGTGGLIAACATDDEQPVEATPIRGGTLRVAAGTGRGDESVDPHFAFYNVVDQARIYNLYDGLVRFDPRGAPRLDLAEELSPDASGTEWMLRIRPGVSFHDGRSVTTEDVAFSLRRAADPKSIHAPSYEAVEVDGIRIADSRTLIIPTVRPIGILPQMLANATPVVPTDFDPAKPIGSGPFTLEAFQTGQQSRLVRYPDYWNGPATLDELLISGIVDPAARVNALEAGQLDLVTAVPRAQARTLTGDLQPLQTEAAGFLGFAMSCQSGPFQDVRVRQALRLIVDREAMVRAVLAGYGRVANDIYAPADPAGIDPSIPQWEPDIDQAKSLLREAGVPDLTVEVTAAPTATGAIEMCTVLAEQARAAGVTINVRQLDINAYIQGYGTYPLAVTVLDQLGSSFARISLSLTMKGAPFDDAHFEDPEFDQIVSQSIAELDPQRRANLVHEAQRIFHDRGGHLIWGFVDFVDAGSSKISGFVPNVVLPLGGFDFKSLHFTG